MNGKLLQKHIIKIQIQSKNRLIDNEVNYG